MQAYTTATNHSHGGLIKTSYTRVDMDTHRQNQCLSILQGEGVIKKIFAFDWPSISHFPGGGCNVDQPLSERLATLEDPENWQDLNFSLKNHDVHAKTSPSPHLCLKCVTNKLSVLLESQESRAE